MNAFKHGLSTWNWDNCPRYPHGSFKDIHFRFCVQGKGASRHLFWINNVYIYVFWCKNWRALLVICWCRLPRSLTRPPPSCSLHQPSPAQPSWPNRKHQQPCSSRQLLNSAHNDRFFDFLTMNNEKGGLAGRAPVTHKLGWDRGERTPWCPLLFNSIIGNCSPVSIYLTLKVSPV